MAADFSFINFASQSTSGFPGKHVSLRHLGIIMDGNRRWAARRGVPSLAGHRAGAKRLESLLPALRDSGICAVTVYAFSEDNWRRDAAEVRGLFQLCRETVLRLADRCRNEGVRVCVIGRRDRLPDDLLDAIDRTADATAGGSHTLRVALDYSARQNILDAVLDAAEAAREPGEVTPADVTARLGQDVGPVDLVIRTGNEQRMSDFLLWEAAYAELYFTSCLWPDFDAAALEQALVWYAGRQRRFGG